MSAFFIAPIVEGKGEVEAVPKLLDRLFRESKCEGYLAVNPAIRVKAGSFLKQEDYFGRHVELAARKAKAHPHGTVLVLLDCEDDCPARVGPALLQRARKVRSDVPIMIALAYREYETWFLAAARSLRSIAGLPTDLEPPVNPECIRGAKEWLGARMTGGYDPIEHQPLFTDHFSLTQASAVRSFARLKRSLDSFLAQA
jgi:hypothetical protein